MRYHFFIFIFMLLLSCNSNESTAIKGLPSESRLLCEDDYYSIYLHVDSCSQSPYSPPITSVWIYNKQDQRAIKRLTTNPRLQFNGYNVNEIGAVDNCWIIDNDSIKGLSFIVEGITDLRHVNSSIVYEKLDTIINLGCNAGILGLGLDESVIIAQSFRYYKQGGRYNVIHAYDYDGKEVSSMETNLHENVSEEEEYYKQYKSSPKDLFEAKVFSNGIQSVSYQEALVWDSLTPRGIVLFLHGSNGRGTDNQKPLQLEPGPSEIVKYMIDQEQMSCYVLVPQLSSGSWESQCDILKSLIDHYVESDSLVDKNLLYICGTSLGGGGTWSMIRRYPDFFKGAMPVAMRMSGMASEYKGTKICYVTGASEGNRSQDAIALERAGLCVKYWFRPDANHGWTCQSSFTRECLDWLFKNE